MSRELTIREIYRNNEPQQIAVKGYTKALARLFCKEGIPITEPVIRRQIAPYREEIGATRISWTRAIVWGLTKLGRRDRAQYLTDSFAILTEAERVKMNPLRWIEKLAALYGEIIALVVSKQYQLLELKMCELRMLAEVRFV